GLEGLGGPFGTGTGFGKACVAEAGDGGFALFFSKGGGDLLEAGNQEHVVLEFLVVGGGAGIGGLGGSGDIHVAIPGGEADFEFGDEGGALIGEKFGQRVFDFIGEVVVAHILRLVGEVDLNEAQAIDSGSIEPRYIRVLVRQGSPLGE